MDNTKRRNNIIDRVLGLFSKFETIVSILISGIIGFIILVSTIRIIIDFYQVFIVGYISTQQISFHDYQLIFGKILTLLIGLEFMNSILRSLKYNEIRTLLLDIILITGIAIARKLIVMDYGEKDTMESLSYAALLVAVGVAYFLIKKAATLRIKTKNLDQQKVTVN